MPNAIFFALVLKNILSEDSRFDPNRFFYSGFSYGAGNALKLYSPVLARTNPPWKALVVAEPQLVTQLNTLLKFPQKD